MEHFETFLIVLFVAVAVLNVTRRVEHDLDLEQTRLEIREGE